MIPNSFESLRVLFQVQHYLKVSKYVRLNGNYMGDLVNKKGLERSLQPYYSKPERTDA